MPSAGALTACNPEGDVLSHYATAATQLAAPNAPMTSSVANAASDANDSDQLLALILSSLDDAKAEEIVTIDLRGRSDIADHMVICEGRSSRQVAAIAERLVDRVKTELGRSAKVEGKEAGDWVLIDLGDAVIHVFRPEVRAFYQLEKMWLPPSPGGPADPDKLS